MVSIIIMSKHTLQSKKESKESSVKIIRRFVVTKFVKTCDELVIGHQELHSSSKRKTNLQKVLKFRQIVEIQKTCRYPIQTVLEKRAMC